MEILFLAHRAPFPPDRGDKIRSFHILSHLAVRAHVHLVAFADDPKDRAVPASLRTMLGECVIVDRTKSRVRAGAEALASGRPVSLAAFDDARVRAAVDGILATRAIDAIYVFSGQMAQYLPTHAPRTIMDFVDCDSAKFAGYAETASGPKRWLMRREARLLGAFERGVAARVEASLFVSRAEAALFPAPRVATIENGIDAVRYDPATVPVEPVAGPLIVFTGQMDYPPNVEAVVAFARDILPRIRAAHPEARFAIVGRAPTAQVQALASEAVIVTGEVADVRPWLAAATVVVAPLALARGIQNKVLEAMAMARAVVASPAAAEGIDHAGTIRVADGATAFAETVTALLSAPQDAAMLGWTARAQVIARYGWEARLAPLDDLLGLSAMQVAA